MYRMSRENFHSMLRVLETVGGTSLFKGGTYCGLAKTGKIYPRGQRLLTPFGEQELVVGVDVEISKWLDLSSADYIDRLGVTAVVDVQKGQQNIIRRLKEANERAKPRVFPFYLTPNGQIFYKLFDTNLYMSYKDIFEQTPSAHSVGMFEVSKKEIPRAERTLRTVRAAYYTPEFINHHPPRHLINSIVGGDGLLIDDPVPAILMGQELRLSE